MALRPAVLPFVAVLCLAAGNAPSFGHVTLATEEAPIASYYKAVFRVPHGCKGAATVKLRVEIPPGVVAVKPQPKPGWKIEITKGKYANPHTYHGSTIVEGVTAVTWSDGKLPDEYFDEFVLSAFLSRSLQANTTVYFPVVQTCEMGENRWIETPGHATGPEAGQNPAPALRLRPAK